MSKNMDIALGLALAAARNAAGLTQDDISRHLVSPRQSRRRRDSTIGRWEKGEARPDDAALAVYAELTNRSEAELWADALKRYPAILRRRAAETADARRAVRAAQRSARPRDESP